MNTHFYVSPLQRAMLLEVVYYENITPDNEMSLMRLEAMLFESGQVSYLHFIRVFSTHSSANKLKSLQIQGAIIECKLFRLFNLC
ncbi:hypothetical protein C0J52_24032 [Blattella germanica]|nr:hypothetical protein C0J52_24032 [Blattella germanica]